MDNRLRVELLADHLDALPTLTQWFEREWAPYYGSDGPGNAEQDLLESCNRHELPIALVAIAENRICGTAALKSQSVTTHPHLSPWLAALLVAPGFRRQGIGERLIAAVEDTATRLGFTDIYVGTGEGSGTPESALLKRGWLFLEKGPYFKSEVFIFSKRL